MEEESVINLTPLIDVVFVILIMFILVAPMLDIEDVELANKSKAQTMQVDQEVNIQIYILNNDTILLNKRPIDLDQIPYQLSQLKTKHPRATPMIFCDKKASFGLYQDVKNALENVGFESMQIALKSS